MRVPFAEQATVVYRVEPPHNCWQVIAADLDLNDVAVDLAVGSVVRCRKSCGKFYQRYGDGSSTGSPLWREVKNRGTDQLPSWQPTTRSEA